MSSHHKLLKRQIEKLELTEGQPPDSEAWKKLLDRVSKSYEEADQERYLLERSLNISSREMTERFDRVNWLIQQTHKNVLESLLRDEPVNLILEGLMAEFTNRAPQFLLALFHTEADRQSTRPFAFSPGLTSILDKSVAIPLVPDGRPEAVAALKNQMIEIPNLSTEASYGSLLDSFHQLGVKRASCYPIQGDEGEILATFAVYSRTQSAVAGDMEQLLMAALKVARVALCHAKIHRRLEQERLNLINQSKMAALGEMAGGIAHEINNPLTILTMNLENLNILLQKDPIDIPKITGLGKKLLATADRIAKIVRGLKSFSRNSPSDLMEWMSVRAVLQDTLEFCMARFKEAQVELLVEVPENLQIRCRPAEISQVFLNLLSNALFEVKAKPSPWVKIACELDGDTVRIRHQDCGSGIPEHVQTKMFNPFFTTKPLGEGTGLGLSICIGIVQAHKGRLYYNKDAPHTEFVIELPGRTLPAKATQEAA